MTHIARFFHMNPIRLVCLALGFTLLSGAQNAFPILKTTEAASPTAALQGNLVGGWSFPFSMPTIPIHTSVLPNGKVLIWGRDKLNNADIANSTGVWIYDPNFGTFTSVANSTTNLFCSGHSFLPNGSLLVAGGHDGRDGFGEPDTNVFNYTNNTWSLGAPMNQGRWYPSTCTLGSGEVVVVAGQYWDGTFVDPPNNTMPHIVNNTLPQVWQTNAGGGWRNLTTAQRATALYPWLLLAPNGKIFSAGPDHTASYLTTSGTGSWSDLINSSAIQFRDWGSAVMFDDGRVMITGGGPPAALTETIDLNVSSAISPTTQPLAPEPKWVTSMVGGSMLTARKQLNATILADGKVLVTGGTSSAGFNVYQGHVETAEMWDPETQQWGATAMASEYVARIYHSTAVLLPDGSVFVAGGGRPAGDGEPTQGQPQSVFGHFDAELYFPPYFFKGARPVISSAPPSVNHGQQFFVATPDAANITRVTLIRLSSVTHAFNESQRINYLSFQRTPTGLNVTTPGGNNLCPPGYYMLFILNGNGVPSVASIVQVTVPASNMNSINDQQYFVRMHYEDFLGRSPDRSGLDFWTGQITQCGNDPTCISNKRVDVARAFWESGEFQDQHRTDGLLTPGGPSEYNSTEFVRWNYRTYLRRQPDSSGLNFWTNNLNNCLAPNPANGQCYNNTIKAFITSGEYRNRFNQP